jgi:hypothetical protein
MLIIAHLLCIPFFNGHHIWEKVRKKSPILNLFFFEAYNSKMENNADYHQSSSSIYLKYCQRTLQKVSMKSQFILY